jgi:capsular polysaccharide biosynthesis protein
MDLRFAVAALRRWWWLLLTATLAAGAVALVTGRRWPASYEARATVLVHQAPAVGGPSYSDVLASQQLTRTYSQLATADPVLDQVAAALGLPARQVAAMVKAQGRRDTQLIDVIARGRDPALAARAANEVAEALARHVQEAQRRRQATAAADLSVQMAAVQRDINEAQQRVARLSVRSPSLPEDQRLEQLAQARADLDALRQNLAGLQRRQQDLQLDPVLEQVMVVNPARVPETPVGPSLPFRVLLGGATGLAVALVVVAAATHLDDRVQTGEEAAHHTRLPILGRVPRLRRTGHDERRGPTNPVELEPFRALLAGLALADPGAAGILLVTSAGEREGRTTMAAGLARAAAAAGRSVLLVDGDLRRPALHLRFALPNQAGLTTLLTTPGLAVEGLLQPVGERLRVLTAGPPTEPAPWPPERLAGTVRDLARAAELVLVDGPSLADGAETAMLAAQADGVLLVAAAGRTRVPALTAAVDLLAFAGARVRGVVLNRW